MKAQEKNTNVLLLIGGYCIALGAFLTLTVSTIIVIMKISETGKKLIKQSEGLRLTAYKDAVGVLTIGYGHTGSDVKTGMTITQAQADQLLAADVKKFEDGVAKLVKGVSLTQNQFDALVSFAYNLGLGNLQSSTLLKKVKANPNDPTIRNEFNKWINADGKPLPGLITRRKNEANLYFA